MVHHGLWDYDNPTAPNLVTITVGGRRIDAVAQVTKQGFTYVFDRVTGERSGQSSNGRSIRRLTYPARNPIQRCHFPQSHRRLSIKACQLDEANDSDAADQAMALEQMKTRRLGRCSRRPRCGARFSAPAREAERTGVAPHSIREPATCSFAPHAVSG
jgi:quinoprotein glucose dehydrogenase